MANPAISCVAATALALSWGAPSHPSATVSSCTNHVGKRIVFLFSGIPCFPVFRFPLFPTVFPVFWFSLFPGVSCYLTCFPCFLFSRLSRFPCFPVFLVFLFSGFPCFPVFPVSRVFNSTDYDRTESNSTEQNITNRTEQTRTEQTTIEQNSTEQRRLD